MHRYVIATTFKPRYKYAHSLPARAGQIFVLFSRFAVSVRDLIMAADLCHLIVFSTQIALAPFVNRSAEINDSDGRTGQLDR